MSSIQYSRCVNPFEKKDHGIGKNLRNISSNIKERFPNITAKGSKICNSCRKEIYALSNTHESFENFSGKYMNNKGFYFIKIFKYYKEFVQIFSRKWS